MEEVATEDALAQAASTPSLTSNSSSASLPGLPGSGSGQTGRISSLLSKTGLLSNKNKASSQVGIGGGAAGAAGASGNRPGAPAQPAAPPKVVHLSYSPARRDIVFLVMPNEIVVMDLVVNQVSASSSGQREKNVVLFVTPRLILFFLPHFFFLPCPRRFSRQ
jgi:hypothetical protein